MFKFTGDAVKKIHVRRDNEEHALEFKMDKVTPMLLQKVFQLESAPDFLISETHGEVVGIDKSELKANEYYTINGLDVRNRIPGMYIQSHATFFLLLSL